MSVSLSTLRTEILQRLGDSTMQIWTSGEIEQYIQEGYDQLTLATGCLLGVAVSPDYAFAFSYTSDFEYDLIVEESGWLVNGPAQFTSEFERDFLDNASGPANHTASWEFNAGYQTTTEVSALINLPDELYEIERATWNTKRVDALSSSALEWPDSRYELNKGEVIGYTQDKDGLRRLRKWRVPSTGYTPYDFDDDEDLFAFSYTQSFESTYLPTGAEDNGPYQYTSGGDFPFAGATDSGPADHNYLWEARQNFIVAQQPNDDGYGVIRDLGDIADVDVTGDGYGDLVQVDGVNVFEDFGILGPIYKETNAMRIEYRRRGQVLSAEQEFEIPDRYTVYVRHYAQAKALRREGSGQELELAAHYQARYEAGAARMMKRRNAMAFQRVGVIGGSGSSVRRKAPPLARLPWQYGQVVR